MTISHGPVFRLAMGFLTITLLVMVAGWYAVRRLDEANRDGVLLAREQLPAAVAALNVERLALRGIASQSQDRQSAWYLEKAIEAVGQAEAGTAKPEDARETHAILSDYVEAASAEEEAAQDYAQVCQQALESLDAADEAVAAAHSHWDQLSEDTRATLTTRVDFDLVWQAHGALRLAGRALAAAGDAGAGRHVEEALRQIQAASRLLQSNELAAAEGASPEDTALPSATAWEAVISDLRSAVAAASEAVEKARVSAGQAAEAHAGMGRAEEALMRQVQAFSRANLTETEALAHRVASGLDAMAGVWWLGLMMLIVTLLAITIVSIASTGRSLEEANLPLLCQCGKLNAPTSHFCGRCGHEFT